MSAENCALSQRWFEEVWNERRTATIVELMSPDGIGHMESGDLRGVEPFKLVRDEFIAAVPDLKFAIEGIVADGDDVVVRWCASGTHSGEGLGIEPTQQQLVVRGMTWQRFKDGVLVEGWDGWNQEALFSACVKALTRSGRAIWKSVKSYPRDCEKSAKNSSASTAALRWPAGSTFLPEPGTTSRPE